MKIQILAGVEAVELLHDDAFLSSWTRLAAACPWTTCLQQPGFVRAWYSTYSSRYEPVLVLGRDIDTGLNGLLTLATEEGQLAAAGTHHAEYQTWLAQPGAGDEFMEEAVEALSARFPNRRLRLQFLPGDSPVHWTTHGKWRGHCDLIAAPRGLMALGTGAELRASLRKKGNRSRANRLERSGPLSLETIRDPANLDEVLPTVMEFCDLRQGAIYNSVPFSSDPRKRIFYSALMRVPGLLHVTVLKAGARIVSAHFDMLNRDTALLGLIAHSPFDAQHSPGKLHLLLLGLELLNAGISTYDLTPGGEYKDRFATHYDQAYILTVSLGWNAALRYRARRTAITSARRMCAALHIDPGELQRRLAARGERNASEEEFVTSEWSAEEIARLPNGSTQEPLRRNSLADLLEYRPAASFPVPRDRFWREALARLEEGWTLLSATEEGRVAVIAWVHTQEPGVQTVSVSILPAATDVASVYLLCLLRLAAAEPRTESVLLEIPRRLVSALPPAAPARAGNFA